MTHRTSPPRTDLTDHLRAERDVARRFNEVLRAEQQALIEGQVDALSDFAQQKAGLVQQSTQLAQARQRSLAGAGLPAGRPGVEAWVAAHPAARTIWADLVRHASDARQINRTNGVLIGLRLEHVTQALAALLNSVPDAMLTYSADGHSRYALGGRPLASA